MNQPEQTVMWEQPRIPDDPTPLETGGALVIIRLSPAEVEALSPLAPTLNEALHILAQREVTK